MHAAPLTDSSDSSPPPHLNHRALRQRKETMLHLKMLLGPRAPSKLRPPSPAPEDLYRCRCVARSINAVIVTISLCVTEEEGIWNYPNSFAVDLELILEPEVSSANICVVTGGHSACAGPERLWNVCCSR